MWYNIKVENIGMSPSGKALDFDSSIRQFKSGHPSQKKASRKTCFFLSNPKDWYVITRRVYGIAVGVWHHAPACISLRIDAIHHFVMISCGTLCRFHTATSCGFHKRLRRDWETRNAPKLWTDSNRHTVGDDLPGVPNKFVQTGRRGSEAATR